MASLLQAMTRSRSRLLTLLGGGVGDELPVDAAHADAGDGAVERDVGDHSAAEAPVMPWMSPSFSGSEEITLAMTWVS